MGKGRLLVGVDLGSYSVKFVELETVGKSYGISKCFEMPMARDVIVDGTIFDYSEVVNTLQSAITKGSFRSHEVATTMSGTSVVCKRVRVPCSNEKELNETFLWEAEQYIAYDFEDVNLDYKIEGFYHNEGYADVFMVAARKDVLTDVVSVFESADFEVAEIDVEAAVLANLAKDSGLKEDFAIILQLGHKHTTVIFLKDGNFDSSTIIQNRSGQFCTELIQSKLDISLEDAEKYKKDPMLSDRKNEVVEVISEIFCKMLCADIDEALGSCESFAGAKLDKIYVSGGFSNLYSLKQSLFEHYRVEVAALDACRCYNVIEGFALEHDDVVTYNIALTMALKLIGKLV